MKINANYIAATAVLFFKSKCLCRWISSFQNNNRKKISLLARSIFIIVWCMLCVFFFLVINMMAFLFLLFIPQWKKCFERRANNGLSCMNASTCEWKCIAITNKNNTHIATPVGIVLTRDSHRLGSCSCSSWNPSEITIFHFNFVFFFAIQQNIFHSLISNYAHFRGWISRCRQASAHA